MLELAILHERELQETYVRYIDKPEYKHYNRNGYTDYSLEIQKDNWKSFQYVSMFPIATGEKVIGYFEAEKNIAINSASISAIHFNYEACSFAEKRVFAEDLREFINDMLVYRKLNKLEIVYRESNPRWRAVHKMVIKLGGRYIGYETNGAKDEDGKYTNRHLMELTRDNYISTAIFDSSDIPGVNPTYNMSPEFYEKLKESGATVIESGIDTARPEEDYASITMQKEGFFREVQPAKGDVVLTDSEREELRIVNRRIMNLQGIIDNYNKHGLVVPDYMKEEMQQEEETRRKITKE